jgi:hypothetical protein
VLAGVPTLGVMSGLRYVLGSGSVVFGLSALVLILFPSFFVGLLGLDDSLALIWAMVMIGVTVIALTGNMAVVALTASDSGVRVASIVMGFSAAGLGMVTLLIPVPYTWFTIVYAVVGFGFSLAYLVGLLSSRAGR